MSKKTVSDIPIQPLYSREDLPVNLESALGKPGEYPYTRGIHQTMYRGKLWTMRQYAGFGSAKESNERYRYLISQGTTGLSIAFDLPTQMGKDPGNPMCIGEVGKVGVSIASVEDMAELLEGIPLDKVSVSMTINATAATLLAFLLVVAKEKGISWKSLQGTIQNDILKEYIARGTYIYPLKPALRIITDIFSFCSVNVPEWNTISISGYHIREAGSTAVQEVAFTLANARAYVKAALNAGLAIDTFAPRLAFFFNCHNEFFEEVAKFRAARRMWAEIMKEFGAKKPQSMMLRFHTQTAGSSLTAQQPLNNIVRTSLQAFAAVCGGTQSLHTNSYDEALGLPTAQSATVALRTQQILAFESGAADTVDPLAGSYYVEALTSQLEQEAKKLISRVDEFGGMEKAIELGFPQSEIENSSYRYQQSIESGERTIVGVNKFSEIEGGDTPVLAINPLIEKSQIERLSALKGKRDQGRATQALASLKNIAQTDSNLMPAIIEAAEARCTVGEISDVLREIFGEYRG